jgi:hypothetical protein
LGYFFPWYKILTKKIRLGYSLGAFPANSSGHPAQNHPSAEQIGGLLIQALCNHHFPCCDCNGMPAAAAAVKKTKKLFLLFFSCR